MADDVQKIVNMVMIGFVVFIIIIMFVVARVVSTFMAQNKNKSSTATYAQEKLPTIELLHRLTMNSQKAAEKYLNAPETEKAKSLETLITLLEARKQETLNLIEDNPQILEAIKFPKEVRDNLPEDIQSLVESEVILVGKIKIRVARVRENEVKKNIMLSLLDSGSEYTLYFSNPDQKEPMEGEIHRVYGTKLDDKIVVESLTPITTR